MNFFGLANVSFRKSRSVLDKMSADAEKQILTEIQARLSGLGEPPQLGYRVTLADIQKAIRMSEIGEPYYMFALFRDMIENDPHLAAMIGQRVMSFMGQSETIEPIDPDDLEDKKAAEFIEDIIANCDNWREGSTHLAQGHIWPVSACEKIYAQVTPEDAYKFRHPTQWRLRLLHPIPWPLFTYKVAYWMAGGGGVPGQNQVPGNTFVTGTGAVPINNPPGISAYNPPKKDDNGVYIWNPQDWHADLRFYGTLDNGVIDWSLATGSKPDKVRHVIHSAQVATSGMRENYGCILRGIVPLWFYKRNLIDWLLRGMERYGSPFAVAKANIKDKAVNDLLTKAFDQASKVNALLVPNATNIELKEVQVSGMTDGFVKAIDMLDSQITKGVVGQTMSSSSKGNGLTGGSGQADLQGEVREEWSLFDKRSFCDMQSQQIFDPILKINGYRGRCRSVRGGVSANQQAMLAKTLQSLALSNWFVDDSEKQKMTNTFGFKMSYKEPEESPTDDKTKKSKADHKNPAKGSIP
jgi:Protein of unknown function (DUF935)